MVTLGTRGRLAVCDLDRDEKEQELGTFKMKELSLLGNGRYVFASPSDIFDLKRRSRVAKLEVPGVPLWADKKWKRAIVQDGFTLFLWDAEKNRSIAEFPQETHGPSRSFSPAGDQMACVTLDGRLRIIDLPEGRRRIANTTSAESTAKPNRRGSTCGTQASRRTKTSAP